MRWIGAALALGIGACASYGGTQVTYSRPVETTLTRIMGGSGSVEGAVRHAILWYIWNDFNDPDSKLSVESRIWRAGLNSGGWTCKDYNARGWHLTKGLFYELTSLATGEQSTPNGDCVSSTEPPIERTARIADLDGAAPDTVRLIVQRMGFACGEATVTELTCVASFDERETVKQPPEVAGPRITHTDFRREVNLTHTVGQPLALGILTTQLSPEVSMRQRP